MIFVREYLAILIISFVFFVLGIFIKIGYFIAERKNNVIDENKRNKENTQSNMNLIFSVVLFLSCIVEYLFNLNSVIGICVIGWFIFLFLRFVKNKIFKR